MAGMIKNPHTNAKQSPMKPRRRILGQFVAAVSISSWPVGYEPVTGVGLSELELGPKPILWLSASNTV